MDAKFIFVSGVTKLNTPAPLQPADEATAAAVNSGNVRGVEGTTPASALDQKSSSHPRTDEKALDEVVNNLNRHIQNNTRALHFHVDET